MVKMKRGQMILLVLVVVVGISCIGCGDSFTVPEEENTVSRPKDESSVDRSESADVIDTEDNANDGSEADGDLETTGTEDTATEKLRDEFKNAMDSYEEFYDEYLELVKKYSENPTDISLISDYTAMMTKAVKMDEEFKKWDGDTLNHAEMTYYIEVQGRISKKLIEISSTLGQ